MTAPSAIVLRQACEQVSGCDPVLARAYAVVDLPTWRRTQATYQSLARIVVYQLISTRAADAIWQRLLAHQPAMTARSLLEDDPQALLACGLSRPKLGHLQAIAEAIESRVLDFDHLASAPPDDARKTLLSVRGIGPWTAETFLMNALGCLDAFPHGDVGLIEAYRQLSGATERLPTKAFSGLAEAWRPYRAVGAHLLYDWLSQQRDREKD